MKAYKDFEKQYIGSSDVASLIMVGYKKEMELLQMYCILEQMIHTVLI